MRETMRDMMANVSDAISPKIVANNTVRYTRANGDTVWRLHQTDVVTRYADGAFELNSGGWKTVTTKDRISAYAPCSISSIRGVWYVNGKVPFVDGMKLAADGTPNESGVCETVDAEARALKRKIAKFCKLVDTADELPKPNSGDCWLCGLHNVNAPHESMGELGGRDSDTEHLISHMDEGYLHGSLLVNAMRWAGYGNSQIGVHYAMNLRDTFKRALRRYLGRKCGLAV